MNRGLVVLSVFLLVDWCCSRNKDTVSTDDLILLRRMVAFVILLKQLRASVVEYGRAVFVLFCNRNWGLDGLSVGFVLGKRSGVFGSSF